MKKVKDAQISLIRQRNSAINAYLMCKIGGRNYKNQLKWMDKCRSTRSDCPIFGSLSRKGKQNHESFSSGKSN